MPSGLTAWARQQLLTRLLEAHERSRSFGAPGPWPRDVIVRLDAAEFPEAFAPDGRERLEALRDAARLLEAEQAARVASHVGPSRGTPKELRLGPAELPRAYQLAGDFGFHPLAQLFAEVRASAERLARQPGLPGWMERLLAEVGAAAERFDAKPLGTTRPGLKKQAAELLAALEGAAGVSVGWDAWERVVSERIFKDSKRLGQLRARVVEVLVRADPRWDGVGPDDPDEVLGVYGVRRKPGLIRCSGVGSMRVGGRTYALEDFAPAAQLPEAWSGAWADGVSPGLAAVTTIENEFPFLSYVDEAGGPLGLGARGELVIYVAGFPTPGLIGALKLLSERTPDARWRHWGDPDVGGLKIWWNLRTRLGRAIEWFRSTPDWVERMSEFGRPLSPAELGALDRLDGSLADRGPEEDVLQVRAVVATLRRLRRKLEQERY